MADSTSWIVAFANNSPTVRMLCSWIGLDIWFKVKVWGGSEYWVIVRLSQVYLGETTVQYLPSMITTLILGPIEQGTIPSWRGVHASQDREKHFRYSFLFELNTKSGASVYNCRTDAMSFTKVDTPAGTLPAMIVQKCHDASKEVGMCA
jgi:hypothetical protein